MITVYDTADKSQKREYLRHLIAHCALSNIHSNSTKPFLEYRVAENIFCDCFKAENVSRSDVAVDAVKDDLGIGIKTFIEGTAFQKIAEFDKNTNYSRMFDDLKIIEDVSKKRNYRLDKVVKQYNLSELIYHYIVRYDGMVRIFECPMYRIDIDSVRYVSRTGNTIDFTDGIKKYKFAISKSTLYMEFDLSNPLEEVPVNILSDPSSDIIKLYEMKFGKITLDVPGEEFEEIEFSEVIPDNPYLADSVILPLFSTKKVNGKHIRYVPEKSGLNQWNASGRKRDPREVYIPVPMYVHKKHPGFFPPRTDSFDLELPGGKIISAKLCQSGDKGLMSNPNKELGRWLLDSIFEQPIGELVTYDKMEYIHVNAVRVSKLKNGHYYMNFIYVPLEYELSSMIQISSSR